MILEPGLRRYGSCARNLVQTNFLAQCIERGEESLARRGIQEIDGLAGVSLGKQLPAQASDVFHVYDKAAGQLALHTKGIDVGEGSFEIGINRVIELALGVAEGNTGIHVRGQGVSDGLWSVGYRQIADRGKARVGAQIAEIGIG